MKIRNERVDNLKIVARVNENFRRAAAGFDGEIIDGGGFEGADAGGADGDNFAAAEFSFANERGGTFGHGVKFFVHGVFFDVFGLNGAESSETDVEGDETEFDAGVFEFAHLFGGEMQTGGWRGGTATNAVVDRLIAFGIGKFFVNVGRQRSIFRKLLSVPEYKEKFLRKLGDVFRFLTTDRMLSVLEPLVEEITPEMELHWARWGEENDQMVLSDAPTTVDGAYRYWERRVERLRNVCRKRPTYLWEMIQNAFELTDEQMVDYIGDKPDMPADAV